MRNLLAVMVVLTAAAAMAADLNIRDFGAKGDGETDDTAAFHKALDEAGKVGTRVDVPAGRYVIRGHLDIPEAVTLRGTFEAPARTVYNEGTLAKEKGSILLAYEGKGAENATPFSWSTAAKVSPSSNTRTTPTTTDSSSSAAALPVRSWMIMS